MSNQQTPSDFVHVDVTNYDELFQKAGHPIAVDTYQRGFVWDEIKIKQLISDLEEYSKSEGGQTQYYMGAILLHLHDDKKKLFIIDGQQRLTALSLLYHHLHRELPSNFEMTYSPSSAKNITRAVEVFEQYANVLTKEIFEKIVFTKITVDSVDLAFTFFDTQNNRGVPLHGTDLLKAYHLRAIDGDAQGRLQRLCAGKWEAIQKSNEVMNFGEGFVPTLFSKFLWRSRAWRGNQARFESHDSLMDEFQIYSTPVKGAKDTLPLYRARNNRLGRSMTLKEAGYSEIQACPIVLGNDSADLPFAIRQPVHQGVGFFLYADKYAGLLHRMIHSDSSDPDILAFREHYKAVVEANSVFLKEAYLLAALMYLDQFGTNRLFEFSLWLNHGLGAIRIEKQSVYMQAAKNYFNYSERSFNLLDTIANAFSPEEVIRELSNDPKSKNVYLSDKVKTGERVRGVYKRAVLDYYGKDHSESLSGWSRWINDCVREKL